jgi:hypothetical protein
VLLAHFLKSASIYKNPRGYCESSFYYDFLTDARFPALPSPRRRAEQLNRELARVCSGRENHAGSVELKAVRTGREIQIIWGDAFTGQAGWLGAVPAGEAAAAVRRLFTELRTWRMRCGAYPAAARMLAKAVGV